jgi:hypothetical protein
MTDDFYRHASAQMAFMTTVHKHRPVLADAMRRNSLQIDRDAPLRSLVRLARVDATYGPALRAFEDAVRASLVQYVEATPPAARNVLEADAQFLVDHFDRYTKVPITTTPVTRVVSWARRKFRGAAQDAGDVD